MTAREHRPSVLTIVTETALAFNVLITEILSPSRLRRHALPRQVAMTLTRELTGRSLPEVGRVFRRDHTTVMHGIAMVAGQRARDKGFAARYALLTYRIALAPRAAAGERLPYYDGAEGDDA